MNKQLEIAMYISDKQISALGILFEVGMNGYFRWSSHENNLANQ